MNQPQLFHEYGAVRTPPRSRYRIPDVESWQSRTRARLIGNGLVRTDPITGRRYEFQGQHRIRRAYPHTCITCGTRYWQSRRTAKRRPNPDLCGQCAATNTGAPDGTTRPYRDGYIQIKHKGEWKLEHRHVIEQHHGRELLQSETVHHINGQRDDNRIENLQIRQGHHGAGIAYSCQDCGSHNVLPVPLGGDHTSSGSAS